MNATTQRDASNATLEDLRALNNDPRKLSPADQLFRVLFNLRDRDPALFEAQLKRLHKLFARPAHRAPKHAGISPLDDNYRRWRREREGKPGMTRKKLGPTAWARDRYRELGNRNAEALLRARRDEKKKTKVILSELSAMFPPAKAGEN